ncbi:hypothetical protein Ndes2526B_g05480 [Nannochloris sp. 'desiccata']
MALTMLQIALPAFYSALVTQQVMHIAQELPSSFYAVFGLEMLMRTIRNKMHNQNPAQRDANINNNMIRSRGMFVRALVGEESGEGGISGAYERLCSAKMELPAATEYASPTAPFTAPPPLKKCSPRNSISPARSQPPEVELAVPVEELASTSVIFAVAGAPGHDLLGHAECAARVPAILEALESHGINQNIRVLQLPDWYLASPEEIAPVHIPKYIAALERTSENARDVANVIVDPAPTYVTQTTYRDALNAAGAAMSLVDHVVAASLQQQQDKGDNAVLEVPIGFSICRPPGHHAVPTNGMGFCLLNNAAVAVKHAQQVHGLKKVAVYDFDVHHGNGTEDVFTSDPSVLFISTHQSGSYPNTGKAEFVGKDDGEGTSINIPLPGDAGHLAAFVSL